MDISKIDKNFAAVETTSDGFDFYDVANGGPFSLEGLPWFEHNGREYYRIPKELTAEQTNEGVPGLSCHTSGVCVRFQTDSTEIQIKAKLRSGSDMNHMTRIGSCGFDSYSALPGKFPLYNKSVSICHKQLDTEICTVTGVNESGNMKSWIVNFPLYGGVERVCIGIRHGSTLQAPLPHKISKPILFYGSSITQGGCASRPGNMYPSLLCRALDAEQINLGFSGSARGETAMAEAIAGLELSAFLLDYDHNAPSAEHLWKTHEPFFKIVRAAHPDLPVVMASMGDFRGTEDAYSRRNAVRTTYENAVKAGDRNVYFVDGETLFGNEDRDASTVDGCHPNDLGFYRMYRSFLPVFQKIFSK